MDIFEVISTIRTAFGCLLFAVIITIINNCVSRTSESWRKSTEANFVDIISICLIIYTISVFFG